MLSKVLCLTALTAVCMALLPAAAGPIALDARNVVRVSAKVVSAFVAGTTCTGLDPGFEIAVDRSAGLGCNAAVTVVGPNNRPFGAVVGALGTPGGEVEVTRTFAAALGGAHNGQIPIFIRS